MTGCTVPGCTGSGCLGPVGCIEGNMGGLSRRVWEQGFFFPGFTFAFLRPGRGFLCPPSLLAGEGHDLQLSLFQVTREPLSH